MHGVNLLDSCSKLEPITPFLRKIILIINGKTIENFIENINIKHGSLKVKKVFILSLFYILSVMIAIRSLKLEQKINKYRFL